MRRALELSLGPIMLTLAAKALGSLALFAIAVGLALIYVGAYLAVDHAGERLRVGRTLDRHEALEGEPFWFTVAIDGLGRIPVTVQISCPSCDGWHDFTDGVGKACCAIGRPGRHQIGGSLLRIRDDLGLFSKFVAAGAVEEVLVLPAPLEPADTTRRGSPDASGDPEPDGLRPYVAGTPMSRIHWPSVARGGELQARHFTVAHDELPLVVVDTEGAASREALDWVARAAAGHALALARSGGCRVLLPGDRRPTVLLDGSAGWPILHRRFAMLTPSKPVINRMLDLRGSVQVRADEVPAEALAAVAPLPRGVLAIDGAPHA